MTRKLSIAVALLLVSIVGVTVVTPVYAQDMGGLFGPPRSVQNTLTAGTMTFTNRALLRHAVHRFDWTNAMVVALGAATTGNVSVCVIPAKTVVVNMYVVIDTPDTSANALTVSVGRTGAGFIDYIVASDAKATANTLYGGTAGTRGTNLTGFDFPSVTATTTINAQFVKTTTNLNTVVGSTGHIYLVTETLP